MSENLSAAPIAGDIAILARRYAGALYDLAEQSQSVDTVAADLRGLRRVWNECPEWQAVARDPRLSVAAGVAAAAAVVKSADLNKLTGNFIAAVAQNRRLPVLPFIIESFLDDMAARRGEYRADIRSAQPLSSAQKDALIASLGAASGGKVHLAVTEDASILGGLTIKMGSKFIDASVKTRLDLLERQLKTGAAA